MLTKRELVFWASQVSGISGRKIAPCLDALTTAMRDRLIEGEEINLPKIGMFTLKRVPPEGEGQTTHSNLTDEDVFTPAYMTVQFKLNRGLKDAVKRRVLPPDMRGKK